MNHWSRWNQVYNRINQRHYISFRPKSSADHNTIIILKMESGLKDEDGDESQIRNKMKMESGRHQVHQQHHHNHQSRDRTQIDNRSTNNIITTKTLESV